MDVGEVHLHYKLEGGGEGVWGLGIGEGNGIER
jgi:hypothetical protein